MVKHTLKILRCEHRKILKVCLAIFQHYAIRGLSIETINNFIKILYLDLYFDDLQNSCDFVYVYIKNDPQWFISLQLTTHFYAYNFIKFTGIDTTIFHSKLFFIAAKIIAFD